MADQFSVSKIAQLANIPITEEQATRLGKAFRETLEVISHLNQLDTKGVEPTYQVTGKTNVFRADKIDAEATLSQESALKNAHRTWKGYIVVPPIFADQEVT